MSCCPHSEEEHYLATHCLDVIHYPSEDYPCLCEGFDGEGERCGECAHKRESHQRVRECKPRSGEICTCRQEKS